MLSGGVPGRGSQTVEGGPGPHPNCRTSSQASSRYSLALALLFTACRPRVSASNAALTCGVHLFGSRS